MKLPTDMKQYDVPYYIAAARATYTFNWFRAGSYIHVDVPNDLINYLATMGIDKVPNVIRDLVDEVSTYKFKNGSCGMVKSDDHTMLTGLVVEWAEHLAGASHNPLDATPSIYSAPKRTKSAHKCRCEMVTLMSTGCKCGGD
jgi:hypothetical protein